MKNKLLLITMLFILASCAGKHTFMRGSVVMKVNKTQANICMGVNEVKLNDAVVFEKHKCKKLVSKVDDHEVECSKRILGTGTVTKLLNNHYSQVTTNGSFNFHEGTLVVKK